MAKEEKICYKMVSYTLYLSSTNGQKSCYKVRIYKPTFLKGAWHLTLLGPGFFEPFQDRAEVIFARGP